MKTEILIIQLFLMFMMIGQPAVMGSSTNILNPPNISSIHQNPNQFLGNNITLKGIVTTSYPNEHWFILTDKLTCGSCAAAKGYPDSIHVYFSRALPDKGEIVQVFGELIKNNQHKILLNATSIA
jgi:hypothetical protein